MSDEERTNHLESLLDDALASYSKQEPRPGLERRVLDRIHATAPPRFVFPRWAWVVPAAACLLWAGLVWTRHDATPQRAPVTHVATARVAAPALPEIPRSAKRVRKRKGIPRLPQFPAPAPLSDEERALLAFVTRAPKEAQEGWIDTQRRGLDPIRIEAIQIQSSQ